MAATGWYPRRREILQHLDNGTISLVDSAVHDFLCLIADHKTGVASASAEKIFALAGAGITYKTIQRSLVKLEKLGWIKRWNVHGKRGNYPVLVCSYFVRDVSMTWVQTSGSLTTDWRDVKFEPVHDQSFNRPGGVHRAVRDESHEEGIALSGNQDLRLKTENKNKEKKEEVEDANRLLLKKYNDLPVETSSWIRQRILARASKPVRNPSRFVAKAVPTFMRNLNHESEIYFEEIIMNYMNHRMKTTPRELILSEDISTHFDGEIRKHNLGCTYEMLNILMCSAATQLGLTVRPRGEKTPTSPAHSNL